MIPKNTNTPVIARTGCLFGSLILLAFTSAVMGAVITPVTYDFGTGVGKTTFEGAGFAVAATSVGMGRATNLPDGVLLDKSDTAASGFHNAGLLKTFTGLGGGETNNFVVTTRLTLSTFNVANANNERIGSIHLFADSADAAGLDTGITVQLLGSSGTNNDNMRIRTPGINGGNSNGNQLLGYDFAQGDVYDLTATGTYSGTILNLIFLVSRNGGAAQSVSANFDTILNATLLDGTFFGVSMRMKTTTASEFDTFSVIPEPSSTLLAAIFGGIGTLFRRRASDKPGVAAKGLAS